MKSKLAALLLLIAASTMQAQEFKTPLDYLNYIGKETNTISKSTWKYTSTVAHSKNARRVDATRKALVKSIQNATKKIEALKNGYKGDMEYRDQMLAYLAISEKQINQEYDKIINMQEVAEQSYDFMEAYILARDLVNQKINDEVDKLNDNQRTFGGKYNIQIVEDTSELGKKMKTSGEVFENQTKLFLIFFRVNITESNLMKAIEAKDVNAIQQNINALDQYATEGLEKLKTFVPYKKDLSLVNATKKALEFYKKEALDFGPKVVSYLMFNQKFEENKKALDSKSESSRSKAEIDNFNKLIDAMNKEVEKYNTANNKFNADRMTIINNWNDASETFISRHVPID